MNTPATECDYSPYAQLVAALLPRSGGVTLFAPNGELRWTSEEAIGSAAAKVIAASASRSLGNTDAGECAENAQREPLYLFWLRNEAGALISILSVSWRSGERDQRTFSYVHAMLRPVLECLRRELALRAQAQESAAPAAPDHDGDGADLKLLLATTGGAGDPDGASDGVQHLLQSVNQHMNCEFTALLLPERNLVVVTKAEGREVDTSALPKVHRHLLAIAQARNEAVMLNAADSLSGAVLPQRVLSCPVRNRAGRVAGVMVLFRSLQAPEFRGRDATLGELLARRAASVVEANYDSISGLMTSRIFAQRAVTLSELRVAGRSPTWSALIIDIDRLQHINDNHGMQVGDKLIARLGELIRARLVPGALAARLAGGRFGILLPTGESDAVDFAEALRAGVESLSGAHLGATDTSLRATVSIGVAAIADPTAALPLLLANAEVACARAEAAGRNCVAAYRPGEIITPPEEADGEPALRAIIEGGRLTLHAQSIAPLSGAQHEAPRFELLLRVLDEQGEVLAPGRFVGAALGCKLMPEVDRWVVKEAVRQLAPSAALLAAYPAVFNINLSGQSLVDTDLADFVIDCIRSSGIPSRTFCFEFPENAAIADLSHAEVLMRRLRDFGCGIALDNFGTGISSLTHLRTLPVNMLKIDGSFVLDLLKDPRVESMVQAMTQLAHSMEMTTVAQCVESDEIRVGLAKLGVDFAQGFVMARPTDFAEIIRDLPAYAAVAIHQGGEEIVLGSEDDTICAELQHQLLESALDSSAEDPVARMERVLAEYDHSESTLYQPRIAG